MLHVFISMVDTTNFTLYRGENDGEIVGITVENYHINGLEINLEHVITFNHSFRCLTFVAALSRYLCPH